MTRGQRPHEKQCQTPFDAVGITSLRGDKYRCRLRSPETRDRILCSCCGRNWCFFSLESFDDIRALPGMGYAIKLYQVLLKGMGDSLKHYITRNQRTSKQMKIITSPFNRASLLSRNLFLGSIPWTAFFSTSPPPHFSNILSIDICLRLPGRVL
jgi:hypothetical protein